MSQNGHFVKWKIFVTYPVLCFPLAGADTISYGLKLMLLNLARFPEAQQKCYEELKARNFESDEFVDCPYLHATVWESARYSSGVYRSLIHSVTQPTDLNGHSFKKDDFLAASLYGIHTSEKYFPDPYSFKPERYIVDGVYRPDDNLMPFSAGKRKCPGYIFATIEVYHFTKNLLR